MTTLVANAIPSALRNPAVLPSPVVLPDSTVLPNPAAAMYNVITLD